MKEKSPKTYIMKKKHILTVIIIAAAVLVLFLFLKSGTQAELSAYIARIEQIDTGSVTLYLNNDADADPGMICDYVVYLEENTVIEKDGQEITISELQTGDFVTVCYTGGMLETAPAQPQDVVRIIVTEPGTSPES